MVKDRHCQLWFNLMFRILLTDHYCCELNFTFVYFLEFLAFRYQLINQIRHDFIVIQRKHTNIKFHEFFYQVSLTIIIQLFNCH